MVESDFDGLLADAEVGCQVVGALDTTGPGAFQFAFGDEGAAGEVVGGCFGLLAGGQGDASPGDVAVEPVAGAVVDDVFELMEQGEALPGRAVLCIEADDPLPAVPVAEPADRQAFVGDGDAWHGVDVADLRAVGVTQDGDQSGGLASAIRLVSSGWQLLVGMSRRRLVRVLGSLGSVVVMRVPPFRVAGCICF